ncbi:hypothetical protein GVN18_26790 [Pseudomonas sp. ODNR1LW]|nr:hypothetical protein [Pseudomonas sp. ODNR1LW]
MDWKISLGAIGAAAVLGAGAAWTQVQPQQTRPTAPSGPTPTETGLTPSRADQAALAAARQDPLAARLRGVLGQDKARAPLLAQIEASTVPVLGPADPGLLSTARFYPGDRQYTLVVRKPGLIVEIFGSVRALQSPTGVAPAASVPVEPQARSFARAAAPEASARAAAAQRGLTQIHVEQTEYGIDVAFVRFGAAYNLTFICDSMGTPDCTEAAAVGFAASLQLLGGGDQ